MKTKIKKLHDNELTDIVGGSVSLRNKKANDHAPIWASQALACDAERGIDEAISRGAGNALEKLS